MARTLFGTDGVRGVAGRFLTAELALALTRAATARVADMLERRPEEVIRLPVRGMLPKNRLARKQLTKLKVYAGPEHPHEAQKPQPMEIQT